MFRSMLIILGTLVVAQTSFGMLCCNSGTGTCNFYVKQDGKCEKKTVSITGPSGDFCESPANNPVYNISFQCNLIGGYMESESMTKSMCGGSLSTADRKPFKCTGQACCDKAVILIAGKKKFLIGYNGAGITQKHKQNLEDQAIRVRTQATTQGTVEGIKLDDNVK